MDTKRPGERRTMIGGPVPEPVDELTIAFGSVLLHEPDLVASLLALDELFVDAGDG